ncbi:Multidrug transporter activation protein [Legionella massiliensis]|uniref:Multidrug transporter activation protein n=1 Tax=Legionella massiliensis TaxID=1034943 RepID=A0A078KTF2_9GAMM|nr:MerR family transcriptional regulator [Legionella massiliensis]CDZ77765.1 Multidrug transporter activation protein [Legionella massiliensis]CEE13503.1 HTH-type transcriptional activator mta [Legionella massiliensis]
MRYTIKQLAKLSGVSTRTLRFYDEIGLLKPAFYGDNQYRYYKEEQLLLLQQILFFRELEFPLNTIERILNSDDFDKIKSLEQQKSSLKSNVERTEKLIQTIDKTISHLRGQYKMRTEEMFEGFDPIKQQEHEQYMLDTGLLSQQQIDDSWQRVAHWKKADWEKFNDAGDKLHLALMEALQQGEKVDSAKVQKLIQQHFDWVNNFWTPTKESYLGLGQMYLEHPDFRAFYEHYHPDLAKYIAEAMKVFAALHLNEL